MIGVWEFVKCKMIYLSLFFNHYGLHMHGKPRGIKIDKHFKPNIQYCFMGDIEYQTIKLLE